MHPSRLPALLISIVPMLAAGQLLSAGDKAVIESARARYYNLQAAGFQSLSCSVNFDFSTVPLTPTGNDELSRKFIKATKFTLTLDANGRPAVQHSYPSGATVSEEQQVVQVANLLTSLVAGLFQTWPTKGLQGPVPAFDSQIEDVNSTDRGYTLHLRVPGGPVQLFLDKAYTVTEVVSNQGKLHEHPLYGPSPDGLVFVGNDATDDSQPGGRVEVKYELGTTVLDGLRVPSSAHLLVNQNIDVRFSLDGCTVKKALVVHVKPPPPSGTH
jgi:hypothetical protein